MTTTNHVYEFAVSGNADVIQAIKDIIAQSKEAGEVSEAAFSKASAAAEHKRSTLNTVGDALNKIKGDVDSLGGQFAATFTRGASDAIGMLEALGTGGVLGAVSAISIAVGAAKLAWDAWSESVEHQAKAAIEALEREKKAFDDLVSSIKKQRAEVTKADLEHARAVSDARQQEYFQAVDLLEALQRKRNEIAGAVDAWERGTEIANIEKEIEQAKTDVAVKAGEARRDANEEEEIRRRLAAQKTADEIAKNENKTTATVKAHVKERREAQKASSGSGMMDDAVLLFRAAEAEKEHLREMNELITNSEWEQWEEQVKAATKVTKEHTSEIDKANEAEKRRAEANRESARAQDERVSSQLVAMAIDQHATAGNYVLGASIDYVSGFAREWGTINRENARDMLDINKNSIAAWARYTQQFLFNLGLQAGQKALMEVGEAGKETALAVGQMALGDMAGGGMHLVSAGMHMMAAKSYAAIGGVAVGASLAIGSQRGAGGVFDLTKEEREGKGGGGGGRAATGGAPSRGRGNGNSVGGTVDGNGYSNETASGNATVEGDSYNITNHINVYMPGAIDASDNDHLKKTTARGLRGILEDGFLTP